MKKILLPVIALTLALGCNSCRDMFLTDPDDIINVDDYISQDDEMYKGFLGIMTRMQQAADHSIILTDTRGDYFQVTANAPLELQKIYTYDPTDGNSYADPAPYYAIVIACNDYIDKMKAYREKTGENMDEKAINHFNALISSTIRLKVWAYLKMGSIYGQAVWFDDPLEEKKELSDSEIFTLCNMSQLVDKCLDLLDKGLVLYRDQNISSQLIMDWAAWINEEDVTDNYTHWQYMIPPYLTLRCELLLWRGNPEDYLWVRDTVIKYLYKVHQGTINDGIEVAYNDWRYACNIPIRTGADNLYATEYYRMFYNELYNASNFTNFYQVITGIMYDYEHHQTNHIIEYFCPRTPGKYYLRPSNYAIGKYNESDLRSLTQRNNMDIIDGDTCFCKYYYHRGEWLRTRIVEIQPVIPLFRGHDYHFYLAEAENHLGNWHQAEVIMNNGVTNEFADKTLPSYWAFEYNSWFCPGGGYGDIGVASCAYGNTHDFPMGIYDWLTKTKSTYPDGLYHNSKDETFDEAARMREYDLLIMDEALSEYAGEGRAYAYVCRMAERYGAAAVVDRIADKYKNTPYYEKVRSAILAGDYWVKWDLKTDDLNNN